ncbi:LCP family protein [Streptomyces sp. H10-C2]|uniref:LCP family protein n=1 Tax=unclassified Streptomyces TaxID=2593676 RepID=UPI0024BA569E|nr:MULTISPECIES: LCP family protein [unclassified Streptomyces]MDJ0345681.1 LCP family protein [Streptomyces sp. PH10-H1]MDJ0374533.1 LCP family protein [Streptomyces sp. H10-C2]
MPGARDETYEHDGVAPEEIPEATADGPPAPTARGTGRRIKRIVAWTAAGTLVLLVVSGGAIYYRLTGNIKSFPAEAISRERPPAAVPDATGNTPVNVLLIGSDSRGGANSSLGGGESGTARSDTTILLHVYANHRHAIGISIPRDTLVTIPACRLSDGTWTGERSHTMFNEAFSVGETDAGNPACTQNTVEKLTGLRVDHTIVATFEGFAAMTKAVHGVEVCLPNDIYDRDINPNLGARGNLVLSKGKQNVQGQQALDYVRLRHGIGDGSDIGRMMRQQAFLGSLVSKIKGQGIKPTTLLPLADAATRSLVVDPGLDSVAKLLEFGSSLKNIDLHELKFLTTPWRFSGERVELVHPEVDTLWATLKADRTIDGQNATGSQTAAPAAGSPSSAPAVPPPTAGMDGAGIRLVVLDGTATTGLAGKAASALQRAGFSVSGTVAATAQPYDTTVVEYGAGRRADAQKVTAQFPGATLAPVSAAGIRLVLGKNYTPGQDAAKPAGAPTALPSTVVADARSADQDTCANTVFGSGG